MKHYVLVNIDYTMLTILDDKDFNPQIMTHLDLIYGMSDNLFSKELDINAEIPKLNVFKCNKKPKDIMQLIVLGYAFNDNALNLLHEVNLPQHALYPLQYLYKKNWYEVNYLVIKKRLEDYIDYEKTTFVYTADKEDSYVPIQVVDHFDYLEKVKSIRFLKCRELCLTVEGVNFDLFYSFIFCGFVCSERFKETYERLKLSGLGFSESSQYLRY